MTARVVVTAYADECTGELSPCIPWEIAEAAGFHEGDKLVCMLGPDNTVIFSKREDVG